MRQCLLELSEIIDADGQGDFGFEIFIEGWQVILMETVSMITVKMLPSAPIILAVGLPLDHTMRIWPEILQMKVEKCLSRKLLAKAAETAFLTIIQNKQVTTEFNLQNRTSLQRLYERHYNYHRTKSRRQRDIDVD